MTLVSSDENRDTLKKYEELLSKIRDLIRSTANNSDDCDNKYIKIKFNSQKDFPLKETLIFCNMVIVVRSVFRESNKYYPKVFLDEYLQNFSE